MKQKLNHKVTMFDYLNKRKRMSFSPEEAVTVARDHPPFLYRMNLMKKLPVHTGCVNTIYWNKTGEYILSGSDDGNLCITRPINLFDTNQNYSVLHKIQTRHLGNIFCARFMPNSNDSLLVSSSSDGPIIVHNVLSDNPSKGLFTFNCHSSIISKVIPLPDVDKVFLSCGEDRTVRLFDLRCHKSCPRSSTCPHPSLIRNSQPITTLDIHPINSNLLLVGRADGLGLVYDRRKLPDVSKFSREQAHKDYLAGKTTAFKYMHPFDGVVSQFSSPEAEGKNRFTSLCYSADATEVLASYSQDYIYLFSTDQSSNFELVQTLPRVKETQSGNDEVDDDSSGGNDNQGAIANSSNGTANDRGPNRSQSRSRGPKIRMRGDWSDTGIHSVPYGTRDSSGESNRPATVIQRIIGRVRSGSRRNRPLSFIPMADLLEAAPELLEVSHDLFNNIYNNNRRSAPEIDGESAQTTSDNNTELNENNDRTRGGIRENERVSDNYSHQENLDDDVEMGDTSDEENDANDVSQATKASETESGDSRLRSRAEGRPRVSQETKEKFRRTIGHLKGKFSSIPVHHPHVCYQGHRNSRTFIKEAIFWGKDYIMSGSDCGRIMVWEKKSAKLVMGFPADTRVVNCLSPNPWTYALASSGIDYDIKLWSTHNRQDNSLQFSDSEIQSIIRNNELMLEESRQTITVPPHLFFRILASFASSD